MKVVGFVGSSGSGKTTLIGKIIPLLKQRGLRVSTIKHAHHGFDMDRPGKDSYQHREAGADEVMVVSGGRWALLHELRAQETPSLDVLLAHMAPVDMVLIEGFKCFGVPKIEVYRPSLNKPAVFPGDPSISAVATDTPISVRGRYCLSLNRPQEIASFILRLPMSERSGLHAVG